MKLTLRTSLLIASLAGALVAQADTTLTAALQSSVRIDDAIFAYQSADGSDQGAAALATILPDVPYSGSATVKGSLDDYLGYRYTLVGTYGASNDGIVIGLNPLDADSAVGRSFTQVFGGGTSEASLVTYVKSAYKVANGTGSFSDIFNAYNLQSFLTAHKSMLEQGLAGGSLISFSNGAKVGTLVAVPQAVPEPASFAALGIGGVGLLKRRKRHA